MKEHSVMQSASGMYDKSFAVEHALSCPYGGLTCLYGGLSCSYGGLSYLYRNSHNLSQ